MKTLTQMFRQMDDGQITAAEGRAAVDSAFPGLWAGIAAIDRELKSIFGKSAGLGVSGFQGERDDFSVGLRLGRSTEIHVYYSLEGPPREARPCLRMQGGQLRRETFYAAEPAIAYLTRIVFEHVACWQRPSTHRA